MNDQDFSVAFVVDHTPAQVFDAINNVRAWWSGEIEGDTDHLGAEFTYRYEDMHFSRQRIAELVPGRRVVWHVEEGYLSFVDDKNEWTGTDIVFDITPIAGQTEVRFTHVGLSPQIECFDQCSSAWSALVAGNLRKHISTGVAQPNAFTA